MGVCSHSVSKAVWHIFVIEKYNKVHLRNKFQFAERYSVKSEVSEVPVRRLETAAVVISWFVLNISIASSTKWIFVKGSICIQAHSCRLVKSF